MNEDENLTFKLDNTVTAEDFVGEPISIGDIAYTSEPVNPTYTITLENDIPEAVYDLGDSITNIFPQNEHIDPSHIDAMCEHYPALAKKWEQFKTLYDLVKDDYKTLEDKEDEIPF